MPWQWVEKLAHEFMRHQNMLSMLMPKCYLPYLLVWWVVDSNERKSFKKIFSKTIANLLRTEKKRIHFFEKQQKSKIWLLIKKWILLFKIGTVSKKYFFSSHRTLQWVHIMFQCTVQKVIHLFKLAKWNCLLYSPKWTRNAYNVL